MNDKDRYIKELEERVRIQADEIRDLRLKVLQRESELDQSLDCIMASIGLEVPGRRD